MSDGKRFKLQGCPGSWTGTLVQAEKNEDSDVSCSGSWPLVRPLESVLRLWHGPLAPLSQVREKWKASHYQGTGEIMPRPLFPSCEFLGTFLPNSL